MATRRAGSFQLDGDLEEGVPGAAAGGPAAGPSALEELLDWPSQLIDMLQQHSNGSLLMANLAAVKDGDLVLDPFAGTGSILLAAALHSSTEAAT